MRQTFDEADFQRKLDQLETSNISASEETSLIWEGWTNSTGSRPLDAKKDILLAKQKALREARKKMIEAIRKENEKFSVLGLLPSGVDVIVDPREKLMKLP